MPLNTPIRLFDAHFHIIDGTYPIYANHGYTPPEFTVKTYLEKIKAYEIMGGAIVSGSFQRFDQGYLKDALRYLGENFYGVANIPVDIGADEIQALQACNVVGVRFNLKRGGSETLDHMVHLSNRLFDELNWHTELYVESTDLPQLETQLQQIPLFSIDHLGLSEAGLHALYKWVDRGVRVKATGFGRLDFDPIPAMQKIYEINPDALLFGTDLPSTRAKTPFGQHHLDWILAHFNAEAQAKILYTNAMDWYARSR